MQLCAKFKKILRREFRATLYFRKFKVALNPFSPQMEAIVLSFIFRYTRGFENRPFTFTVVCQVAWPLNGSEAGDDLVLIQTSLLLMCK